MAFERLDPTIENDWIWGHADHVSRYMWAAQLVAGKRVLDAGTGTGYGAFLLKSSSASFVQAVDIDSQAIADAAARFAESGISFRVSDCELLDNVDGPFDVVCSFENIEHLHHPRAFLKAAESLLSPDGVLVCSTPVKGGRTPFGSVRPPNEFHIEEWTVDEFRLMLSEYFSDVTMHVQICTTAAIVRDKAVLNIQRYLRRNPVLRVSELLSRLIRRPNPIPTVLPLALVGLADFPIVPEALVSSLGEPMCHYAVCRRQHGR